MVIRDNGRGFYTRDTQSTSSGSCPPYIHRAPAIKASSGIESNIGKGTEL